jgi:sugar diacid utilization regulator
VALARTVIVQPAAIELLQRLTEILEIPFTLTDREGAVIASTAGRPAGQVDPFAISVLRHGGPLDITEEQLRSQVQTGFSPAAENAGLLPPAPGIYMSVHLGDTPAAILFARGEPDSIRTKAVTAAAVTGLALEFASGATTSMHQTLGPDLALRALLRGTQQEARRATLLVKVAGWDLLAPRVALVITPASLEERLPDTGIGVLRELLLAVADNAPCGQLSASEWVALPALPRAEAQPAIEIVAEEIRKSLESQGVPVIIGVGETHIDMPILPGLRRSYREAAFCAQSARQTSSTGAVYSLRTLGPLAFFAPSSKARAQVAHRLLEPLRASPEIFETVRVFLETDLSLEATAKRSGQHRHTVRSHLQRVRELTGLDPRSLTDAVQLKLALLIAPIQSV